MRNLSVWFIDCGRWNWDELLKTNKSKEDTDNYFDQTIYRIRKASKLASNKIDGNQTGSWALVANMDGYTMAQSFNFKGCKLFSVSQL